MSQDAGIFGGSADVKSALKQLLHFIDTVPEHYRLFSREELLARPAPGKWSRQEILGHLIDSGLNNWKRFTEIPFLSQPYMIQSYQQNELVKANNYQYLPLEHLLNLWAAINIQIVHAVENIPADQLEYPVYSPHKKNEMKTLGWLICDYITHLEHHWKQV